MATKSRCSESKVRMHGKRTSIFSHLAACRSRKQWVVTRRNYHRRTWALVTLNVNIEWTSTVYYRMTNYKNWSVWKWWSYEVCLFFTRNTEKIPLIVFPNKIIIKLKKHVCKGYFYIMSFSLSMTTL